jgi:Na+-transporting NADH:ubiquinone oxidoreductase subunit C
MFAEGWQEMSRDSVGNTFLVAGLLCVGCSVLVSAAAVGLKPLQEANKLEFKQKNILIAAGMKKEDIKPADMKRIVPVLVNLETGTEVSRSDYPAEIGIKPEDKEEQVDATLLKFDSEKLSQNKEEGLSIDLNAKGIKDMAGLKRRENFAVVFKVMKTAGSNDVETYVLPVRGKGLWSTLYGFLAVKNDLETVAGLTFYKHGETPGLGGEVDNESWKEQWQGLEIYNPEADGDVWLKVVKGSVREVDESHAVDGLSGATITSNGVTHLVQFWLGENGFGPYLDNLQSTNKE